MSEQLAAICFTSDILLLQLRVTNDQIKINTESLILIKFFFQTRLLPQECTTVYYVIILNGADSVITIEWRLKRHTKANSDLFKNPTNTSHTSHTTKRQVDCSDSTVLCSSPISLKPSTENQGEFSQLKPSPIVESGAVMYQ